MVRDIMKKLNIAETAVLVLAMVIPSALIAATPDDEVTIRVMEMHEKSTAAVMNRIQLPATASDKVTEEENYRKRLTEGKGEGAETGLGDTDRDRTLDQEQSRDQEQSYDMNQAHERELDLVQDQIRDTEPDLDIGQQTGNETGAGSGR
jgi:hypothetical protein